MAPRTDMAVGRQPFVRDFVVLPEGTMVRFPAPGEPHQMVIAAARPASAQSAAAPAMAQRAPAPAIAASGASPGNAAVASPGPGAPATLRMAQSGIVAPAAKPRLAIHCRLGPVSACDLDERDAQGRTALAQHAEEFNAEAVALLVSAGADPSIPSPVAGADAIEAWVRRVQSGSAAAGSPQAAQARAVIDSLASSPKARLAARLKADLQSDPAQWRYVYGDETRALLLHAREALAAVPTRPDVVDPCEAIEPIRGAAPPRLR
jgi:hypothetical protein